MGVDLNLRHPAAAVLAWYLHCKVTLFPPSPLSSLLSLEGSHYIDSRFKQWGITFHHLQGGVFSKVIWNAIA